MCAWSKTDKRQAKFAVVTQTVEDGDAARSVEMSVTLILRRIRSSLWSLYAGIVFGKIVWGRCGDKCCEGALRV